MHLRHLLLPTVAAALALLPACGRRDDGPALFSPGRPPVILAMTGPRTPRPPATPRLVDHGERATLIYPCAHQRPEVLRNAIKAMIGIEGAIEASSELNALIVSDAKVRVQELASLLGALDQPQPQLLVEARLVEMSIDHDLEVELSHVFTQRSGATEPFFRSSEVTLGTPGPAPLGGEGVLGNLGTWFGSDLARIETFVRTLVKDGKARILSSPNVVVAAGQEASIVTGEEVPIFSSTVNGSSVQVTTTFKPVGVKLRVLARQISGDTAEIEVHPEVSTVTGYSSGPEGATSPILAVRQLNANLRLKDGEVLSVGGLLRSEERRQERKVPILGDIPVLGLAFRSWRDQTVKTQLMFFLRIHILDEGQPNTTRVHQPGEGLDHLDRFVDDPMRGRQAPERQTPSPAPVPATPTPVPPPAPAAPEPPAAAPPAAPPAAAAPARRPAQMAVAGTTTTTGDDDDVFFDDGDVGPLFFSEDN